MKIRCETRDRIGASGAPEGEQDREIPTTDDTIAIEIGHRISRTPLNEESCQICSSDDTVSIKVRISRAWNLTGKNGKQISDTEIRGGGILPLLQFIESARQIGAKTDLFEPRRDDQEPVTRAQLKIDFESLRTGKGFVDRMKLERSLADS